MIGFGAWSDFRRWIIWFQQNFVIDELRSSFFSLPTIATYLSLKTQVWRLHSIMTLSYLKDGIVISLLFIRRPTHIVKAWVWVVSFIVEIYVFTWQLFFFLQLFLFFIFFIFLIFFIKCSFLLNFIKILCKNVVWFV